MKVVIINKSDSTGGAAVVSRRLLEALNQNGVEARMLVAEKLTDNPNIALAALPTLIKEKFLAERLRIFYQNGFNRKTLFKIDTGAEGLPLWKHPWVKEADAVMLNWVNQGMLSLKGLTKILELDKPVIWTMHDMWPMTGICHHAGTCNHFHRNCGDCPLLAGKASPHDLSFHVHSRKTGIYFNPTLMRKTAFVAVSNWLKSKALESSLLKDQRLEVIHNAFDLTPSQRERSEGKKFRILFGAARLDDPIKGLDTLRETARILAEEFPQEAGRLEMALFGTIKDPSLLENFKIPLVYLGTIKGEENLKKAYLDSYILVSASSYETLPGTLVEAQAYGCIPVAFNRGGQSDIVEEGKTGFLAQYDEDITVRSRNLAQGLVMAVKTCQDPLLLEKTQREMILNVESKFSYKTIADRYVDLIRKLVTL